MVLLFFSVAVFLLLFFCCCFFAQRASCSIVMSSDGVVGLQPAIDAFLGMNESWKVKKVYTNNSGLTILERV